MRLILIIKFLEKPGPDLAKGDMSLPCHTPIVFYTELNKLQINIQLGAFVYPWPFASYVNSKCGNCLK